MRNTEKEKGERPTRGLVEVVLDHPSTARGLTTLGLSIEKGSEKKREERRQKERGKREAWWTWCWEAMVLEEGDHPSTAPGFTTLGRRPLIKAHCTVTLLSPTFKLQSFEHSH